MKFFWFILIGLAIGWLAGKFVKVGGYGALGDLMVGVIGALFGGLLFGSLGAPAGGGLLGSFILATLGAVVLLMVLHKFRRA